MKKTFFIFLFLINSVNIFAQVKVDEGMFVGFKRPSDGIFVIYDAKGIVTIKDEKFAEKLETTQLSLSKFLVIADFYNTLDEARANIGLPPLTEQKPTINKPIQANYNWNIGLVGYHYGSLYEHYVNQINTGISIFNFFGQNVDYPPYNSRNQSTNELSIIDLPTHSIINFAGTDFISQIEMTLTDEYGKEVWHLYDTRGGYHPCINGIDCNSQLRGNNHPDDATRWIKNGKYKLWVNNISDDNRAIQRIEFYRNGNTVFSEDLLPKNQQTFNLEINKLESGSYKINCNVFTKKK